MSCKAFLDGEPVIPALLSDAEWDAVKVLAKQRRLVMPRTGLAAMAKVVRWKGGITRFFSHFPGEAPEGYACTYESPEHLSRKAAVFMRLRELGYPVDLEAGQDDWVADVLVGESSYGPRLAIEIQQSRQSAERTYERTAQRAKSGVPTLWIFGDRASTGHIGDDLLKDNPVFYADGVGHAADIAQSVCSGSAFFDSKERYRSTPALPLMVMLKCRCRLKWIMPLGFVALPNLIQGNRKPRVVALNTVVTPTNSRTVRDVVYRSVTRYTRFFENTASDYGAVGGWLKDTVTFLSVDGVYVHKGLVECPNESCNRYVGNGFSMEKHEAFILRCPLEARRALDAVDVLGIASEWKLASTPPSERPTVTMDEWREGFMKPAREKLWRYTLSDETKEYIPAL